MVSISENAIIIRDSETDLCGLVEHNGTPVIPCQYKYLAPCANELYAQDPETDLWGIIDLNGNIVIPLMYEEIEMPDDKVYIVQKKHTGYGVIDLYNKILVPLTNKHAYQAYNIYCVHERLLAEKAKLLSQDKTIDR